MKTKTRVLRLSALAASVLLLQSAAAEDASANTVDDATAVSNAEEEQLHRDKVTELAKDGLFVETFEEVELFDDTRWFKSTHEKYASQEVMLDEYTVHTGRVTPEKGLVLDAPAKHYGLAVKLDNPLQLDGSPDKKEMVIQYEVKLQKGLTCGGAYVKLLRANDSLDFKDFKDDTPFVIMFGPDKCGSNDKVHFIFQHKNPVTGEYQEKHMLDTPKIKSDRITHIYTLVVRDDNTYEMFIDQESVNKGSLFENFNPPVLPEKEIDDLEDKKPEDWEDEPKIRDPSAVKPDDWDEDAPARIPDLDAVKPDDWLDTEPATIDDPSVVKPEDWDDEDDGEFIPPQIPNPKCEKVSGCGEWKQPTKANPAYKGKWHAPLIPNPKYKGEWAPRKIPNPEYFDDSHPARMDPIGALAVEVWTMSEKITFDNFWIGYDLKKAQEFAELTWLPKHEAEKKKEKKDEADRGDSEGGFFSSLEQTLYYFADYLQANPVVGFGSVIAVSILTTLVAFFVCCGKASPPAVEKDDSGDEDDDKVEEKAVESDDGGRKVRQRKKAPIVKDD